MNPVSDHKKKASARARVAVITLSTSRTAESDHSGDIIQKLLERGGHSVPIRKLIADSRNVLRASLRELVRQKDVHAIITTGGTGLSVSDITIETVRGMLEKELPGFGELFRHLTFQEIGSAAVMSRAVAGIAKGKAVFCLPGSPRPSRPPS
jgi:molybdenum cofactor biosynthesis protein B